MNRTTRLRLVLILGIAVGVFRYQGPGLLASQMSQLCDSVCSLSAGCGDTCYLTQFDFDQDNPTTCGNYGVCESCGAICSPWTAGGTECEDEHNSYAGTTCEDYGVYLTCGDGVCAIGDENQSNCTADCGYCGDGTCDANFEDTGNCSDDCPATTSCEECDVEAQDCAGGAVCVQGGCCVMPCEDEACGEHERTCQGGQQLCLSSEDCCPDEICLRLVWCDDPPCDFLPGFINWTPICVPWPSI